MSIAIHAVKDFVVKAIFHRNETLAFTAIQQNTFRNLGQKDPHCTFQKAFRSEYRFSCLKIAKPSKPRTRSVYGSNLLRFSLFEAEVLQQRFPKAVRNGLCCTVAVLRQRTEVNTDVRY